jgi:SulP family sulfate permease
VGGFLAGLFGGSRYQISGPTAAFILILVPIVKEFGPQGLMMATIGAGMILFLMGMCRLGKLIDFISFPVIAGFTLGIGISVIILQLRVFWGVVAPSTTSVIEEFITVVSHLGTLHAADAAIGGFTLLALFCWSTFFKNVPAALVILPLSCVLGVILPNVNPAWSCATIANHFVSVADGVTYHGIPPLAPHFSFPWILGDGSGFHFTYSGVRTLVQGSFAIAILCAIETLVTAVCGDRLTGTRHNPNGELIGQGIANAVAPFFGGFSTSGAIPRTAANIQAGATSPWASAVHSFFLLGSILLFTHYLGFLPLAAMAALLIYVAYFMSDIRGCSEIIRTASREEGATLLLCAALTILFDMLTAIGAGVVLTSFFFMYRMARMSATIEGVREHDPGEGPVKHEPLETIPEGVLFYKIKGALFFGSAVRMTSEIRVKEGFTCAVIDLSDVPLIDSTGVSQLQVTVRQLLKAGFTVALSGTRPEPMLVLRSARFSTILPEVRFFSSNNEAFRILRTPLRDILPLGSHL